MRVAGDIGGMRDIKLFNLRIGKVIYLYNNTQH